MRVWSQPDAQTVSVSATARAKTPPTVPAYNVASEPDTEKKNDVTDRFCKPSLTAVHSAPRLDLKTPPPEGPAYRTLGRRGSIASARTLSVVKPSLTALQLAPKSALLNTPLDPVAAYNVALSEGSIAMSLTSRLVRPALEGNQFAPLSVLLNTPPGAVPVLTIAA